MVNARNAKRIAKMWAAAVAVVAMFAAMVFMTVTGTTFTLGVSASCGASSRLNVTPVLDLDAERTANAAVIIQVARDLGLPERAAISALMAGITESGLHNYLPTDFEPYTNRKQDHDSLGVFQMRPSMGWGTIAQITDMHYEATTWYEHMQRVHRWQYLPLGDLAQAVEGSAFPERYATHESEARAIYAAITGNAATLAAATPPASSDPTTSIGGTQGTPGAVYTGPVYLLGDSLGVGMESSLPANWTHDDRGGRSTEEGLRILNAGIPAEVQPVTVPWVISLATNQPSGLSGFQTAAEQIAVIAGTTRPVYWFNTYMGANPSRQAATNQAIVALAATHPNIRILDWESLAGANPGWFGSDGIHPSPAGYKAKTAMAVEAVGSGGVTAPAAKGCASANGAGGKIATMLAWAKTQVGAPYAAVGKFRFGTVPWDGNTYCSGNATGTCWTYPAGTIVYDCSGFATTAYKHIGVDLAAHGATSTSGMRDNSWFIDVPPDEAHVQPGDLILYEPVDGIGHVIISMGGSDSIESSGSKGVWISHVVWDRVIQIKRIPPDVLNGSVTPPPSNVPQDTTVN